MVAVIALRANGLPLIDEHFDRYVELIATLKVRSKVLAT